MKNNILRNIKPLKFCGQLTYKILKGQRNNHTGKWVKHELINLGPTYIKIGQIISSRNDLFPKYITEELQSLQDNVPSFDYTEIETIFQEDLNNSIDVYFSSFSKVPIASASISQVHKARIKNSEKMVAVKVQRPNIKTEFENDLGFIQFILDKLSIFNTKNINDLLIILNECTKSIEKEINFVNELENMLKFQNIFKDETIVKVPKVYSKIMSKRILVMEYVSGIKVNELKQMKKKNINTINVANNLMSVFIKTILDNGLLHSDPHPGNISVSNDGTIILYDYGMVSTFNVDIQTTFNSILSAYIRKDIISVMNLLLENEILYAPGTNARNIHELSDIEYTILYKLIEYIFIYAETLDLKQLSMSLNNDDDVDVNNIPFIFNSEMMLLFKTMTTLEGVCKTLKNDFSYNDIVMILAPQYIDTEFIMEKAKTDINSIMSNNNMEDSRLKNGKLKRIETRLHDQHNLMTIFGVTLFINYMIILVK